MFQPPRTRILYHVVIGVATGQSSEVLDSIRNRYTDSVMIIYIYRHRASRSIVWKSPAVFSTIDNRTDLCCCHNARGAYSIFYKQSVQ